jgi:hypothetical protein
MLSVVVLLGIDWWVAGGMKSDVLRSADEFATLVE